MSAARAVDALVFEIGSTTTVVSAFEGLSTAVGVAAGQGVADQGTDEAKTPSLVGQGTAATSVAAGDVAIGLDAARADLESAVGSVDPGVTLATSSAAGGLRVTVHGLTPKMTAMAAREAALGAGGVVVFQTAGLMRDADLRRIEEERPNLTLLAGGVEGGDSETVLGNARLLAGLDARPIVVFAGNSSVAGEARAGLERAGFDVRVTANVYPDIDALDILPARAAIHDAFEAHIAHAPGMTNVGERVRGAILPTPGAVLLAAELLAEALGDLVAVDVGGATTDVYSVTDGSPEVQAIATDPQPRSKRTVEGDLGTFVSAAHVAALMDDPPPLPPALPETPLEIEAAAALAGVATRTALERHAGRLAHLYTPKGRQTVARGRDLTACRTIVGTGGALVRLPGGIAALRCAIGESGEALLPSADARVLLDRDYVMACCGVLSRHFAAAAVVRLMRTSLGV